MKFIDLRNSFYQKEENPFYYNPFKTNKQKRRVCSRKFCYIFWNKIYFGFILLDAY